MTSRAAVIAQARAWIGTPWIHQQCLRGVGADCIGTIVGPALELDLPGAREAAASEAFRTRGRTPREDILIETCDRFMGQVPIEQMALADVLVLALASGGSMMHFAWLSRASSPRYVIHGWAVARAVREHRLDDAWLRRIVRVYRLRGVE